MTKAKEPEVRFKNTPPFKLKKNPPNRRFQGINLRKQFGFLPEVIVIERLTNTNNAIFVRAVMTEEAIKAEDALKSKEESEVKAKLDKLEKK